MNEPTDDPQGLDDPALLAEIEAEFADLSREIERISAMPRTQSKEKQRLIEALRDSWRSRSQTVGDRPEWRQRLDATLGKAVDRMLEDGITMNPDGTVGFGLNGATLAAEGGPVMRGLLEGFTHMLEEKFPPPDKAPPPVPGAPPPSPMQSLMDNFGQVLVGALKTAISHAATAKTGAPVRFGNEEKLATSVTFDTRPKKPGTSDAATATPPSGPSETGTPPASSTAANAFFQQLIQGIGQVMKTAVTPVVPVPTPAPAPAPTPTPTPAPAALDDLARAREDKPLASSASLRSAASSEEPRAPLGPAPAPAPTPTALPVPDLSEVLKRMLQGALGPNAGPVVMKQVPPAAPTASTAPPDPTASPGAPAGTDGTASEEPKPATVQIDLAGLLTQLLSGKKPPGT